MVLNFCKYFIGYIFKAKSRQRLLMLSILGLFISSFSLLVLQSTMGGLQGNVTSRSKNVSGDAVISLNDFPADSLDSLSHDLESRELLPVLEYEIEVLLRYNNYISPIVIHGVDVSKKLPEFLRGYEFQNLLIGIDLAYKISVGVEDQVQLISPAHVDTFLDDIPRSVTTEVDGVIVTNVPEVDRYHGWARLSMIQNLIQSRAINRVRVYGKYDYQELRKDLKKEYGDTLSLTTWENINHTLVWSLKLENTMMLFLFTAMTLLVSLCITSGLLIFLGKIKGDLVSFWILGTSKNNLEIASKVFLNILNISTIILGILGALGFLYLMKLYAPDILPDVFVDRKIPVKITMNGILFSFFIPYLISTIFSFITLQQFKRDENYLNYIRSVGL